MSPASPLRSLSPLRAVALVAALGAIAVACTGGEAVEDVLEDAADAVEEAVDEVAPDPVPDVVRYVALGDSIAAGTGSEVDYVELYAERFSEETGAEVVVENTGVPGWTTDDLLRALQDDEDLRASVADADLVTVNIGGNDLLRPLGALLRGECGGDDEQDCIREAIAALLEGWDAVLDEVLELTDGEADGLRTMDLYAPRSVFRVQPARERDLLDHLDDVNAQLRAAAEARGIAVADVHAAFHTDEVEEGTVRLLSIDGVHPNADGHARIADELLLLGTSVAGPSSS
jgi:lysophospholipase L1-like esterase